MQRLLTGEVRLPGFEKSKEKVKSRIGDVPADWEVIPAGKLFKSSSQKKNGELPLLAVTQENGVVDRNDLEGRVTMPSGSTEGYKLIEEGDFVISLRSFQGGLEFSEIKGIVSPAYTVLKNVRDVDKSFFKFFFKSHEFIQRLAATVIGIRDGKQISYKDFVTLKFRFPPLEEQTAIANILTTADKEITLLETRLTELREQKRGLMQRLLTGQVRVNVATA
jgi:type I restriction enzyme S subunit